jgi:putative NADH-flavin reductase
MKIAVFGATGATGSRVVERALAAGHDVIAVARMPSKVSPRERLVVRPGDALDAASVRAGCAGADAVISCIGPTSNRAPGKVVSAGTANMIAGCADAGVKRFVMQSGITLSDGRELSAASRFALSLVRPFFAEAIADKAVAERAVQGSDLDWVIVRPVGLGDDKPRGAYTAGPLARVSPFLLPFADCADCLLRATTEAAWTRRIVNVGR